MRRLPFVSLRSMLAILLMASWLSPSASAGTVPAKDLPGSRDNPIVSRFAGSVIVGYQASNYDQLLLPLGPYADQKISHTATAEGRITRIAYVVPAGKSALEVWRNFQDALERAGFKTRFNCHGNDGAHGCGDAYEMISGLTHPFIDKLSDDLDNDRLMVDTLWPTSGDGYVETAHLDRPGGAVDVSLIVGKNNDNPVGVLLQICEGKAMAAHEVTVDAKAMSKGLAQNGHIALYGIHFATDSATLTADSSDTLAQMAALLKSQPGLKVYIVGHTDDTGTLAHNLALSQRRAEAVVKALAGRGIDAARMSAKGLASYAPVASNHDDAGRARNRRVELVEQ